MSWIRRYYLLLTIAGVIVTVNVVFYFFDPETIVDKIGLENSYLIAFALAATGGISTFTGAFLYTALVTFSAGGANPLLLALAGGTGIFISDTIFFHLAKWGRASVPPKWESWLSRAETAIRRYPTWVVLSITYAYLGFTPLPNDLLMFALVIGGYRYRLIAPVLLAGSISIAFTATLIGVFFR